MFSPSESDDLKIESPLERVYVPSFRGNPILSGCVEGKSFVKGSMKRGFSLFQGMKEGGPRSWEGVRE